MKIDKKGAGREQVKCIRAVAPKQDFLQWKERPRARVTSQQQHWMALCESLLHRLVVAFIDNIIKSVDLISTDFGFLFS